MMELLSNCFQSSLKIPYKLLQVELEIQDMSQLNRHDLNSNSWNSIDQDSVEGQLDRLRVYQAICQENNIFPFLELILGLSFELESTTIWYKRLTIYLSFDNSKYYSLTNGKPQPTKKVKSQ